MMDEEIRLANYAVMIKNINKVTSQYSYTKHELDEIINSTTFSLFWYGFNKKLEGMEVDTPLAFIYEYSKCNIYAQLIMYITKYSFTALEWWINARRRLIKSLDGYEKDLGTAKEFVKYFKESENIMERYEFIFWALMILTVDKTNVDDHLSLICDYAEMLGITDDEFEDIIRTIKIIYNQEKSYSFKTETVPEYFSKLYDLMKIHVAL